MHKINDCLRYFVDYLENNVGTDSNKMDKLCRIFVQKIGKADAPHSLSTCMGGALATNGGAFWAAPH